MAHDAEWCGVIFNPDCDACTKEIIAIDAFDEAMAWIRTIPCEASRRGEMTYECDVRDPCKACAHRMEALRELE